MRLPCGLSLDEVVLNASAELFTLATTADVKRPNGQTMAATGTNNEAKRTLRVPAMARNTDRASKNTNGAKRRTIVISVFGSLRCFLKKFTLDSITQKLLS